MGRLYISPHEWLYFPVIGTYIYCTWMLWEKKRDVKFEIEKTKRVGQKVESLKATNKQTCVQKVAEVS